jgi:hypothetical protein
MCAVKFVPIEVKNDEYWGNDDIELNDGHSTKGFPKFSDTGNVNATFGGFKNWADGSTRLSQTGKSEHFETKKGRNR